MDFKSENDQIFSEITESYSDFRRKVEEYYQSTAKCKSAIKKFEDHVETFEEVEDLSPENEQLVDNRRVEIEKMCNYLPKENHLLLMLFVGDFNCVLPRNEDKIKYKKQYEMFKLWYIVGQLFFSSLNILLGPSRIVEGFLQFYLVWFYCNLTLKESILTHNGSRIRTWWLIQHYLDIVLYGFLLIRSDGEFSIQFSSYIFYMSGCQILQFYYQQGSLYKLRALGRAESMEVSAEGLRVKTFADLQFLTPFFFILYIFQLFNSYKLWFLSEHATDDERWEVVLCSMLFFVIAIGNIFTLFRVLVVKYQLYQQRKNKKSPNSVRANGSKSE